jgi:hypothetical protein
MRPCLENTQHKNRAGGVVQVVEHLPRKFKYQYCHDQTKKRKEKER